MQNRYPAIVTGGPPHSGKSVLTYNLSQALRRQGIAHFVVRACPDDEGDYSHESSSNLIRDIRQKGHFTPNFVENICAAIQNRHYPLLVDVGGKLSKEQDKIFEHCTHSILISSQPEAMLEWQAFVQKHNLESIAELHSTLTETEQLYSQGEVLQGEILRGRISGLERGREVDGLVFQELVHTLCTLFESFDAEIDGQYAKTAPSSPLDLRRLGVTLGVQDGRWEASDLSKLIAYLPANEPLSIYGRGPTWLYAAIANHVYPAPLHQFDPCLGWVSPLVPQHESINASQHERSSLTCSISEYAGIPMLELAIPQDGYLDYYDDQSSICIPSIAADRGLVVSGALPLWLVTGIVRLFGDAPLLAFYQPQLDGAVVVRSRMPEWPIGSILSNSVK